METGQEAFHDAVEACLSAVLPYGAQDAAGVIITAGAVVGPSSGPLLHATILVDDVTDEMFAALCAATFRNAPAPMDATMATALQLSGGEMALEMITGPDERVSI